MTATILVELPVDLARRFVADWRPAQALQVDDSDPIDNIRCVAAAIRTTLDGVIGRTP